MDVAEHPWPDGPRLGVCRGCVSRCQGDRAMTSVLDSLLSELRAVRGPIRSADLAERVGVSESALSGMIDVLVSKGRLSPAGALGDGEAVACSGGACGSSCVGLDQCAFMANVPATYTLIVDASAGLPGPVVR